MVAAVSAPPFRRVLIANRGEIAVRIARAASELGCETVAVHSAADTESLHTHVVDRAVELAGAPVAAYLDIDAVVAAAVAHACDAIHPGYGFLSESAAFARACAAAGITFVGPSPEALELFGDKAAARVLAEQPGRAAAAVVARRRPRRRREPPRRRAPRAAGAARDAAARTLDPPRPRARPHGAARGRRRGRRARDGRALGGRGAALASSRAA